ncbi:MAG: LytTR family transcriptional regulator DNA-binding domain-containing protein [Chitinophagaceae bacterium]|nr:LytTR family transcriptional regulator DNA-binding domain-containing protein [Chitinophagaceae bacterium]
MLLGAALLLLIFATLGIDFLFAQFQNSSFYISESLLFSSYWLLFLPLLNIQRKLAKQTQKTSYKLLIVGLATTAHLLCYPALVWLLSKFFYYHTFSFWQTFDYGLTAYFIKTIIIYGLSLVIITIHKNNLSNNPITVEEEIPVQRFLTSIIVSDSNNKKTAIDTNDILYFSASSPYVNIHHQSKKYLHTETLKSIEAKLDNHQFIRIHKSHLVNICKVVCYKSRLNGDYDLTLTDDTVLRLSRNYAAAFKACFEGRPHLTTK